MIYKNEKPEEKTTRKTDGSKTGNRYSQKLRTTGNRIKCQFLLEEEEEVETVIKENKK